MTYKKAHGYPGADYSKVSFFIRRMDTEGYIEAAEVPHASFPLVGFAYLTGGEILVEVDGELFHLTVGHLLLIPENKSFSIRYYKDAHGFTGGFSASLAGEYALVAKPLHFAFWFEEASFAGELFNMMDKSFSQGSPEFIQNAISLLLNMLPADICGHPQASQFLKHIFNPDIPFGQLDDYAAQANLTPNGFCRMIRRESGRSPGEWIAQARLTRAKSLLQKTDMPVLDVSLAVGLSDQSYFSRFFRKHTGMTPIEFRQRMMGMHK